MYRDRLWTMRQYAGFSSPEDTNERYRYLIEHGSTGLSMAFDLPTQLGRDSDDPLCDGEVGRTGVPIDTIEDMRICFDQIPLDQVSTSMTINAPAAVLLLLYELVGEEQGVASEQLRGTVQNDVLKEYMARGNYIYPPEPTMRLTTDIFEYCQENVPKWNTISISGYHIREKGCSAVQEVAFTLANAIAYVEAALDRGLEIDTFAPRLAFFFNCHNNVFQEIAKFRAVRRMWAEIVRDRFGSENPRSQMIRFHTQTGGVTLQAQQPEVNIIRVALQGFAAVSGGTQSLHTNGFDEALALPTERSARIALRTQQVIAYESGADRHRRPVRRLLLRRVADRRDRAAGQGADGAGRGAWAARSHRSTSCRRRSRSPPPATTSATRAARTSIVGVNKFVTDTIDDVDILKVDPEAERRQVARLKQHKESRDQAAVDDRLADLSDVAARRRQPAAADEGGAARRRLDRRGLRDAARRLRRVQGRGVLLGRTLGARGRRQVAASAKCLTRVAAAPLEPRSGGAAASPRGSNHLDSPGGLASTRSGPPVRGKVDPSRISDDLAAEIPAGPPHAPQHSSNRHQDLLQGPPRHGGEALGDPAGCRGRRHRMWVLPGGLDGEPLTDLRDRGPQAGGLRLIRRAPARPGGRQVRNRGDRGLPERVVEEVRDNVRRFGEVATCEFRKGWFSDTLPTHDSPVVLAFLDVDYQASLRDCILNLWPHLTDRGYVFIDEYMVLDYGALFFSEKFWDRYFDRPPPGMFGIGSGVGVGEYYLGPRHELPRYQEGGSIAYTRKDFDGHWDFYPEDN